MTGRQSISSKTSVERTPVSVCPKPEPWFGVMAQRLSVKTTGLPADLYREYPGRSAVRFSCFMSMQL
jgi:hypothetical protein